MVRNPKIYKLYQNKLFKSFFVKSFGIFLLVCNKREKRSDLYCSAFLYENIYGWKSLPLCYIVIPFRNCAKPVFSNFNYIPK